MLHFELNGLKDKILGLTEVFLRSLYGISITNLKIYFSSKQMVPKLYSL